MHDIYMLKTHKVQLLVNKRLITTQSRLGVWKHKNVAEMICKSARRFHILPLILKILEISWGPLE